MSTDQPQGPSAACHGLRLSPSESLGSTPRLSEEPGDRLPADVVKCGLRQAAFLNAKTKEDAQRVALGVLAARRPRRRRRASLCKVIIPSATLRRAFDGSKAGTPGVGWGVPTDLRGAERELWPKRRPPQDERVVPHVS